MSNRPLPPELEFNAPLCSLCGEETSPEDGRFYCDPCGISWDQAGRPQWEGDGGPQCAKGFTTTTGRVAECLLEAGHEGHCRAADSFGNRLVPAAAVSP